MLYMYITRYKRQVYKLIRQAINEKSGKKFRLYEMLLHLAQLDAFFPRFNRRRCNKSLTIHAYIYIPAAIRLCN